MNTLPLTDSAAQYAMRRASLGTLQPEVVIGNVYDAFLAGAAHMAELFAQGTALKVERSPVYYTVKVAPWTSGKEETCTLLAYSAREAVDQLKTQIGDQFQLVSLAAATSEEIEKAKI